MPVPPQRNIQTIYLGIVEDRLACGLQCLDGTTQSFELHLPIAKQFVEEAQKLIERLEAQPAVRLAASTPSALRQEIRRTLARLNTILEETTPSESPTPTTEDLLLRDAAYLRRRTTQEHDNGDDNQEAQG